MKRGFSMEPSEDQSKAVEFAGYVLYSGSHTFINNPYYKPFTDNAKKAAAYLYSLGLIEQHPTDESSWRYIGQTEGNSRQLRASTVEALQNIVLAEPIDMILPCPRCGKLHVDNPEPENGWDNPPHKSHLCHGCGTIFRPADVPTHGVAAIKTRGENDSPISVHSEAQAPVAVWEKCPITHRPFFMNIEHPELGLVPTFGGPFDSYTIPETDEDGELRCQRYDHDAGEWVEGGEPLCYLTTEQPEDNHLPKFVARAQRG
jgi:hypothetical protein